MRVEVVVAVDGPDPQAERRLAEVGDPRLLVSVAPPAGRSAARNRAWRAGSGRLVAFLDDDDLLLPDSLAVRVRALDAHPGAVLAHGRAVAGDDAGRPRAPGAAGRGTGRARAYDGVAAHAAGRSVLPSTVLVARDALERAGGFPEDLPTGEDWCLFLAVAGLGPFVALDAPVVVYRRHEGQVRWDPVAQEAALPALLARAFDAPGVPDRVRAARRRVEGRLLAYIARNYRRLGRLPDAHRCLRRAVRLSPRLLLHPRRLLRWLSALSSRESSPPVP